jgi:DNA polymerase-3 subunit epsilon
MPLIAVVDVETTGVNPYRHNRIVEVAVVVTDADGHTFREFVTLVNPERDIGPTSLHGLTASDVLRAPRLGEIAGALVAVVDGCVALAGHNVRFDHSFLTVESERLGHTFPEKPIVCTMRLAGGSSLSCCCADYGIDHDGNQHSALHDARATARLLHTLLVDEPPMAAKYRRLRPMSWPCVPESQAPLLTRDQSRERQKQPPSYLQKLVARAGGDAAIDSEDPAELAYAALLDRVLEDRHIDASEGENLVELATRWGLSESQVRDVHRQYVHRLAAAALADGIVTETERRDLHLVCSLLGIASGDLDELIATAASKIREAPIRPALSAGPEDRAALLNKRVCFTGEFQSRIAGELISREMAEELVAGRGMVIAEAVTKRLDMLVVADPQTQSGKAKKARQYGIRIVHEPVFWKLLGVNVE